jgi:hypothetical protein
MSSVDFSDDVLQTNTPTKSDIPFWISDFNVILKYPYELFPSQTMTYSQKLNAITRTVLILSIIAFAYTKRIRTLIIAVLTFIAISYYYTQQTRVNEEGFDLYDKTPTDTLINELDFDTADVFAQPSTNNPMNNVLLDDYLDAGNKKPAPPSYTAETIEIINKQTKNMIAERNPEQPLINNKLFKNIEDNLQFEQSLRPFYTTASTTIPNDQGGFADFCFGSMVSCKEGNQFACVKNIARHNNY